MCLVAIKPLSKPSFALSDLLGQTPAPIQTQLLNSKEFEVGMVTGFAAGKTRGICAAAIAHAVKYPNAKVLLGRRTYSETINTVKQPFFVMAEPLQRAGWFVKPLKWDYREGTNNGRLVNGSQFFFSNLDDPVKFRNEEYSMVIVDQLEELNEEMWDMLTGRVRWPLVPPEAWQSIGAANDNGHNWVWRRFVKDLEKHKSNPNACRVNPHCIFLAGHPDEEGNPREDVPCATRRFFHGTTLDNRHNLSPRYLASLLAHDPVWQAHFIYATMESGSGRLLLDPVVVPHFDPPASWPRYRAIDHALNSPCCCLWIAVNSSSATVNGIPPNAPYVYREYWGTFSSIDQHTQRILSRSRGENIAISVIDRSAYHKNQSRSEGHLVSAADVYAEYGLYTVPSVGDPFARVERINTMVRRGLAVSDACENLIRQIPEYYAEDNPNGEATIVNKSTFHSVDALGYGLMLIPLDNRLELSVDRPDYLRRDDLDPASRRHHEGEWKRLQAIAAANDPALKHPGLGTIDSGEFWGESQVTRGYNELD